MAKPKFDHAMAVFMRKRGFKLKDLATFFGVSKAAMFHATIEVDAVRAYPSEELERCAAEYRALVKEKNQRELDSARVTPPPASSRSRRSG